MRQSLPQPSGQGSAHAGNVHLSLNTACPMGPGVGSADTDILLLWLSTPPQAASRVWEQAGLGASLSGNGKGIQQEEEPLFPG